MKDSSILAYDLREPYGFESNNDMANRSSRVWIGRKQTPVEDYTCNAVGITLDLANIFSKFQAAKAFSEGADTERVRAAAVQAVRILNSGIFPDFLQPSISVDAYGEFSISLRSSGGYLDIGVCGDNEISYHVRNDTDASKSVYGDVEWDGVALPDDLIEAAIQLVAQ